MSNARFSIPPLYVGFAAFALGLLVATMLQRGGAPAAEYSESLGRGADAKLFQLDDTWYTRSDLDYLSASRLYELEQQLRTREAAILREAAFQAHITRLASEQGRTAAEVEQALLDVPPASEQAIARFYADNRERIGRPLEEVEELIAEALNAERRREIRDELLDGLESQGILVIQYPPLGAPLADIDISGQPGKGNPQAAVTVVEFADYRCPHCKDAAATLKEVMAEFPDSLYRVMLDYPVTGELSRTLAKGAHCARAQSEEAYWSFHDLLFERQGTVTAADLPGLAESLSLDPERFTACMEGEPIAAMEQALAEGTRLGIDATPTIFINGLRYQGEPGDALAATLRAAIRRAQADAVAASDPAPK